MKAMMLLCRQFWVALVISMFYLSVEVSARSLRKGPSPIDIQWSNRREMLAEDQQFWGEMATSTESELRRTAEMLGGSNSRGSKMAGLQLANALGTHAIEKQDPLIGMLDGLYEESKKRIVQLNQHEMQSKQRYIEHQKSHEERMGGIATEFESHRRLHAHMSAALQANETALEQHLDDEENFFAKYWGRVRDRNHRQYHTFLKIQHGLMDRLKAMREALQQKETQQVAQNAEGDQPEVAASALIQQKSFVQDALQEINLLHVELSRWD